MSQDMKSIINELNKTLGKNYTTSSFKALDSSELLQVLSDMLSTLIESPKVIIRDQDLQQSILGILSVLRILQYQPNQDVTTFRQNLFKGDTRTIYSILEWLSTNQSLTRQRAYLSRFLIKIEVPPEYLEDTETSALYERYLRLVSEFKMLHKERESGRKGGEAAAELKADLKVMEKERQVIIDRIEKVKMRTMSHVNLLETAKSIRIERDREQELSLQRSQEKETMASLQISLDRAERKLQILQQTGIQVTKEVLQQRLSEEGMILMAICNERLPSELSALKIQVDALNAIVGSPYVGPDEIIKLRQRLDIVVRQVQALAETKIMESGNDKMAPFRQQAAAIAGVKRNTLEKLEKIQNDLVELQMKLDDKRDELKYINQDSVPKGQDLKRYVARLKSKSGIYKRSRAELAELRTECGVLNRTLVILSSKLAKIKSLDTVSAMQKPQLPENYTEFNATSMNNQLLHTVQSVKAKLSSLLSDIQPMRRQFRDLQERYKNAQRSHDSIESSTQTTVVNLSNQVETFNAQLEKDTEEIKELGAKINKLKLGQQQIQNEIRLYASSGEGQSLKDQLNDSITAETKKSKTLKEEEKEVKRLIESTEHQARQWHHLVSVFQVKLEHYEESKRRDGIVLRGGGAETLILQQ